VRRDSRLGAAVIVKTDKKGTSALDAKLASPHYAKQRQYMAESGKPYEVVEAMTIQKTALWWSPDGGFTTESPGEDASDAWEQIDDDESVLTMTADEALRWDVADVTAGSPERVAASLGVSGEIYVLDLAGDMELYNRRLDHRLTDLQEQFKNYFDGLGGLVGAMTNTRTRRTGTTDGR
jgi:hypothetical protein